MTLRAALRCQHGSLSHDSPLRPPLQARRALFTADEWNTPHPYTTSPGRQASALSGLSGTQCPLSVVESQAGEEAPAPPDICLLE